MIAIRKLAAGSLLVAAVVAACSGSSVASQEVAGTSSGPSASSTAGGGSSATVVTTTAGGQTVLVAGSNGMTLYTFASDTAGSGKSACSGGCLQTWPALTVPAGTTPTAGSGVAGTLGTITRDDGTIQVTYNGLPLYFYAGDHAPGDTNGNYTGWNLVKP
jgi:predicted lipoprotein with Yx(FWY)xxD motif